MLVRRKVAKEAFVYVQVCSVLWFLRLVVTATSEDVGKVALPTIVEVTPIIPGVTGTVDCLRPVAAEVRTAFMRRS